MIVATRLAASGLSRSIPSKFFPNPRLLVRTSEFPSGLQKAFKALAHLLMGKKFTAFQCCLAAFYGIDETIFLLEVTSYNILHNFIRGDALPGRSLREATASRL
jgi:hypothetical protein